jgi:hypothetical protein
MSLKEIVQSWAKGYKDTIAEWMGILYKYNIVDIESLRNVDPDVLIECMKKEQQPLLGQHLRNWYKQNCKRIILILSFI